MHAKNAYKNDTLTPRGSVMLIIMKAAAVIRRDDNKVLLVQRAQNQRNANYWEFPGGKVNPGEKVVACLKRELQEELQITPTAYKLITTTNIGHYETYAYDVMRFEGEINLQGEHQAMQWVPLNKLLTYDLLPAERIISRAVIQQDANSKMNTLVKYFVSEPQFDETTNQWYVEQYVDGIRRKHYVSTQQDAFSLRAYLMGQAIGAIKKIFFEIPGNNKH